MAPVTEPLHGGEFLISEANNYRSREEITLIPGTAGLPAGQLLGIVTASGSYAIYAPGASDGTETVAGVLIFPAEAQAQASDTIAASVIRRDAEVVGGDLTYSAGADAAAITTANAGLAALGIIVR